MVIGKEYVVCVLETDNHCHEAVIRRCDICFEYVWCMPFNLIRIPLCIKCATALPDAKFFLNKENFEAAVKEMKRLHKEASEKKEKDEKKDP